MTTQETFLDYTAVEHLGDFLEVQGQNAGIIKDYTNGNTRFSEGLGWAVQPIGPVGDWVTDRGVDVAGWVQEFFDTVGGQLDEVVNAVKQTDEDTVTALWLLADPGEEGEVHPSDRSLIAQAPASEAPPAGTAIDIGEPSPGEDPTDRITDGLGPVVSTVDEIYSWIFGGSIIQDHVMGPLAGDWKTIQKASDAWSKAGGGYVDMADQIVQYTLPVSWWEGAAAEAFQSVMKLVQVAADWMQVGYNLIGRGVQIVAEVVIEACGLIADIIGKLEKVALEILAKLKIPLVGWGMLAWKAEGYINEFKALVENIKEIIASVEEAVAQAQEMKENFEERVKKAREMYDWVTSVV